MAPTISVCVLIRDEVDMLPWLMPCCASLQSTLKEVVFIDDGSTDGSKEKAFEIASRFRHLPIVWIDHPMQRWDEQRNIGIEAATGDFILNVDADMGWTGNLGWLIERGYFNEADLWTFRTYFVRQSIRRHDLNSYNAYNRTTRLMKNVGIRYSGEAHEQPTRWTGDIKTGIAPTGNIKFCPEVHLLHLRTLSPDDVIRKKGQEVIDRWYKVMLDRGGPPGDPERYVRFKYCDDPEADIPEADYNMIPLMADALKHWGKDA